MRNNIYIYIYIYIYIFTYIRKEIRVTFCVYLNVTPLSRTSEKGVLQQECGVLVSGIRKSLEFRRINILD
jgi:hypothetical protein